MTFEEWVENQIEERNEVYEEIGQECYDNGYKQGTSDAIDNVFKILEEEIDIIDGASWSRLQDRLVKMKEQKNE